MQLENLANIAEIVGLILVLITLVFLILQIRQQTRALKSSTIQAVMQSEIAMASVLIDNAGTWEKVLTGQDLAPGKELRTGIGLYNVFMTDTESRYRQHNLRFLESRDWVGRQSTLPGLVLLPIYESWRISPGGRSHSPDFLNLLDNLRNESPNEQQ